MDLLETAAADIALLMATARALRGQQPAPALPSSSEMAARGRMSAEVRRAATAYVKSLLRSEAAMRGADALAGCRVAAERRMPSSLSAEQQLRTLMTRTSGALNGFAAERHDLWRLARPAIALRKLAVSHDASRPEVRARRKSAKQVRRRLRRALVAYVRAGARSSEAAGSGIAWARRAALDELGLKPALGASHAGEVESAVAGFGRTALTRSVHDLISDWSEI